MLLAVVIIAVVATLFFIGLVLTVVFWRRAEFEREKWRDKHTDALNRETKAVTELENLQRDNGTLRAKNEDLTEKASENTKQLAKAETELKNALNDKQELTKVRENMSDHFKNLSQNILEKRSETFNRESAKMLEPLKDSLEKFRKRTDEIHTNNTENLSALKQQIENLQNNAARYGKSADSLASALRGDSKARGNWGEIQLENLLQDSGLRKGHEYEAQSSYRDSEGNLLRPDVTVRLPDDKHIIIDSKLSLNAYDDYHRATKGSEEESSASKRHVRSIKSHIDGLSKKNYSGSSDYNAPNFVFMFMPIESALLVALAEDKELFSYAYAKNIVLVVPTTLMSTLKTVENLWRMERQSKNAQEIAQRGGALYDKIHKFMEFFNGIGTSLDKAQQSYDEAHKRLTTGRGNIVDQTNKLRTLGATTNKPELPESSYDSEITE